MKRLWFLTLAIICGAMLYSVPIQSNSLERSIDIGAIDGEDISFPVAINSPIQTQENKPTHWAVIVGISDYNVISDLHFCDDDANDWYYYLLDMGYENILVLGDDTSTYAQYDGLATEYNAKQALLYMVSNAGEKDTISFITSGHGAGDSRGASFLCMWDTNAGENGEDGRFWDYEVASILELAVASNIFVFIDHCFAGGFGDDLMSMSNSEHVYLAATCDIMGMGWDAGEFSNGLWTYFFLEYTLIGAFDSDPGTEMEVAFEYAADAYPYPRGAHHPQEYDGNLAEAFILW